MATIAVMLWNIVGWLGFGLMHNHVLKHGNHSTSHCEIALCTCEVEGDKKICTCHHQDLHHNTEHGNNDHQNSYCYYTNPHSNSGNSLQILIPVTNLVAVDFSKTINWSPPYIDTFPSNIYLHLPSGSSSELLRPPII